MIIDLFSSTIGGIVGYLLGFMTAILFAIMPRGKKPKGPCQYVADKCQNDCEDWAQCNEWEA